MLSDLTFPPAATLEKSYAGLSPQLLARTRQMWSARNLELDQAWHATVGRLRGFRGVDGWDGGPDSGPVDNLFMLDQAIIWVGALNGTAALACDGRATRLDPAQWQALQALTFRMIEQLDAIRLLFLTELPAAAMQIARSISEDVDMALAFLARPKLARRFVDCATIDEANEFWRRHIAGGRAFKAVSEQLYRAGLEFDQAGEYAAWRKQVTAILGTAVHTSFRPGGLALQRPGGGNLSQICDCLYFVTLRLQEMCAYSHVLQKDFGEDLATVQKIAAAGCGDPAARPLGAQTARISEITVDQLRWSLASDTASEAPPARYQH
ncbi:hypothetical protein [Puniceibacterium confluentis]|uniref:hypothetical protein n=1 Tax=Puniceibacterium confluentis TaxID=1958944 RepID=UPI00356B0B90